MQRTTSTERHTRKKKYQTHSTPLKKHLSRAAVNSEENRSENSSAGVAKGTIPSMLTVPVKQTTANRRDTFKTQSVGAENYLANPSLLNRATVAASERTSKHENEAPTLPLQAKTVIQQSRLPEKVPDVKREYPAKMKEKWLDPKKYKTVDDYKTSFDKRTEQINKKSVVKVKKAKAIYHGTSKAAAKNMATTGLTPRDPAIIAKFGDPVKNKPLEASKDMIASYSPKPDYGSYAVTLKVVLKPEDVATGQWRQYQSGNKEIVTTVIVPPNRVRITEDAGKTWEKLTEWAANQ